MEKCAQLPRRKSDKDTSKRKQPGDRQAINKLFAGITIHQIDDLERLLAEGSRPNLT